MIWRSSDSEDSGTYRMGERTKDDNESNFDRISIPIHISIGFRFFILIPIFIEGSDTHILSKYPILICEMNCFRKP